MTSKANILPLPRPSAAKLACSACGAETDAACDCRVEYKPAATRAADAIAANPGKSDRAIADDIGVGKDTVRRARKQLAHDAPVEKRIGKDGRTRKLPTKAPAPTGEQIDTLLDAMPVRDVVAIAKSDTPSETMAAWVEALERLQSIPLGEPMPMDDADISKQCFLEYVAETLRNNGDGPDATDEDREHVRSFPADADTEAAAKAATESWQRVYEDLMIRRTGDT
jgi:hypothetical protein